MRIGELVAMVHGLPIKGSDRCFFCGLPADREFKVSSLFVNWRDVANRSGKYRCAGCELSQSESMDIAGHEKKQKARNYSWVIDSRGMRPYSKSHIAELRNSVMNPPEPPYGICIAKSGQKVILYKTPVVTDKRWPALQFEDMTIAYDAIEILRLFDMASQVVVAIGKPALLGELTPARFMKLSEVHGVDTAIELSRWFDRVDEPVFQLVAFLAPSKEEVTCLKSLTRQDSEGSLLDSATSPATSQSSQNHAERKQRTLWN